MFFLRSLLFRNTSFMLVVCPLKRKLMIFNRTSLLAYCPLFLLTLSLSLSLLPSCVFLSFILHIFVITLCREICITFHIHFSTVTYALSNINNFQSIDVIDLCGTPMRHLRRRVRSIASQTALGYLQVFIPV